MSKLNLPPLASGFRSSNKLNENFQAIEDAFENTLSRNGTTPNQMGADLDLNSNRIINLPVPVDPTEPVRLADINLSNLDIVTELVERAEDAAEDAEAAAAETADKVSYTALAASGGAALMGYLQAGTGAVATTVQAKLRGLPISTADWGITADSNGTTGNGTDWTTQLQALVTFARLTGRNIWVPASASGLYIRFTGVINFQGGQTLLSVIGESNFNSRFFADFTSATVVAAFSNAATIPARSYVSWHNFRIEGRSDTGTENKVCGIYSEWGGEFSSFVDVHAFHFYDNFVVANDYYVRFIRTLGWYAKRDNYRIGKTLANVTAPCNNVMFDSIHATHAGDNGVYVYACRALTFNGGACEANHGVNVFLDFVYGASINGLYMEYGNFESGNPAAQLRLRNCNGVTVNGLSVSAFDNSGAPVIYVDEGCYGIVLNGLAIEFAGVDTSAVGVLVNASFGVQINASYFDGMTTGVRLTNGSRVTIDTSNIMAGIPVSTDATGNVLTWRGAIDAQVNASVSSFGAASAVDITRTTLDKNIIGQVKLFPQATGTFGNLAAGGQVIAINAELPSESYRITNIFVAVVDAFGGPGDRDLVIRDGTTVYATIPSASLKTLNAKGSWGDAVVPFGTGSALVTSTVAGTDLRMQYANGTTDYTTGGVVVVYVEAQRIA